MKRFGWVLVSCAAASSVLWACPGPSDGGPNPDGNEVSCTNGQDDNGNGKVDCADPQCSDHPACQPVMMVDAGPQCTAQEQCLKTSYIYDDPLAACVSSKCQPNPLGIDINFQVDVSALAGINWTKGTLNTRFVLKRAVDGSAVTCDVVRAVASAKTADKANQIEASKKFNLLAYDVAATEPPTASSYVIQPFLNTGVGADFLIWTEVWGGPPGSDTKLPTGSRLGFGCVETGTPVAELKPEHHWPSGTPTATSRTIQVKLTSLN